MAKYLAKWSIYITLVTILSSKIKHLLKLPRPKEILLGIPIIGSLNFLKKINPSLKRMHSVAHDAQKNKAVPNHIMKV